MDELLFTPAALLDLLSQIDELSSSDIGITQGLDGKFQLQVGDSIYQINESDATTIEVSADVVEDVSYANESAYEDLVDNGIIDSTDDPEVIESGLIKEAIKSLLVGGVVRMAAKALKN